MAPVDKKSLHDLNPMQIKKLQGRKRLLRPINCPGHDLYRLRIKSMRPPVRPARPKPPWKPYPFKDWLEYLCQTRGRKNKYERKVEGRAFAQEYLAEIEFPGCRRPCPLYKIVGTKECRRICPAKIDAFIEKHKAATA